MIAQTPGATAKLDPSSHALQLTGTDSGLNVFDVGAADLQAAAGIVIDLTKPGATALINVTAGTQLSLAPQYMNLSGNASDRTLMWNLAFATGLTVTHGVAWKGVILAPNATVTSANRPQLNGQLIAKTIPTSDWVLSYVPFDGCLPPVSGSPDLSSIASASARLGSPGASISDVAHLSGGATPTGTITFKLYGPSDTQCTGTAVFSSTLTATGAGYYSSGSFTAEKAGTYRWVVDYSGDQNNSAAGPTACGEDSETVRVSRAATTLSTDVPHRVGRLGSELYDTANLSGGVSPAGTLRFRLYGPDDATCARPPIFEQTIGFAGDGPHNSPGFTPRAAGTYRWVASYSGNANNRPAGPTRCGDRGETVTLTKARPAISTEASPTTELGGQVSDAATVSNGSDPGGTITFRLYGRRDAECSGRPIDTSTVDVSKGNDTYASDQFEPSATGRYRWVASYSGDRNNRHVATSCGDLGEDVVVSRPPRAPRPLLDRLAQRSGRSSGARHCAPQRRRRSHRHDQLPRLCSRQPRVQAAAGRVFGRQGLAWEWGLPLALVQAKSTGRLPLSGQVFRRSGKPPRRADRMRRRRRGGDCLKAPDGASHDRIARRPHRRRDPRHRDPRRRL